MTALTSKLSTAGLMAHEQGVHNCVPGHFGTCTLVIYACTYVHRHPPDPSATQGGIPWFCKCCTCMCTLPTLYFSLLYLLPSLPHARKPACKPGYKHARSHAHTRWLISLAKPCIACMCVCVHVQTDVLAVGGSCMVLALAEGRVLRIPVHRGQPLPSDVVRPGSAQRV